MCIRDRYPLPVVIISALSEKVFDAMKAGAVDLSLIHIWDSDIIIADW